MRRAFFFCGSVFGLHLLASVGGVYGAFAHTDTVLHFLGGAGLALVWVAAAHRWGWGGSDRVTRAAAIAGFVLVGGVAWEIAEFLFWTFLPRVAFSFEFYSPTVRDLLGDLVMDTLGGAAVYLFSRYRRKQM